MQSVELSGKVSLLDHPDLPLRAQFLVAGSVWDVASNSPDILQTLKEVFGPARGNCCPDLTLRFEVDFTADDAVRWRQPHFRALDHLYYATYGPCDSMLMDQLDRRVIGAFSPSFARDRSYWKSGVLPVLLGIASACVGVTPLHCGCAVKNGEGLLLCGESGAGKSTLAVALSLNGFSYLSDDCTYVSRSAAGMRAWGVPAPVKLLPDAVSFFPSLRSQTLSLSLNGELAFEVDPSEVFGLSLASSCNPRWLVFLERKEGATPSLKPLSSAHAATRLSSDLEVMPAALLDQYAYQLDTVKLLVDRECLVLEYGVQPELLVPVLAKLCEVA